MTVPSPSRPLRVAFTGSSGTGKSTLARYAAELLGLPMVPVGARSIAKEMGFVGPDGEGRPYDADRADRGTYDHLIQAGRSCEVAAEYAIAKGVRLGVDETMRPTFQRRVQERKIAWEFEHAGTGFVSDRSTCDDLAYTILHDRGVADAAFFERALAHARTYDVALFCPTQAFLDVAGDPARQADPHYQTLYQVVLRGLWAEVEHPGFITMRASGLEGRKKKVAEAIFLHPKMCDPFDPICERPRCQHRRSEHHPVLKGSESLRCGIVGCPCAAGRDEEGLWR